MTNKDYAEAMKCIQKRANGSLQKRAFDFKAIGEGILSRIKERPELYGATAGTAVGAGVGAIAAGKGRRAAGALIGAGVGGAAGYGGGALYRNSQVVPVTTTQEDAQAAMRNAGIPTADETMQREISASKAASQKTDADAAAARSNYPVIPNEPGIPQAVRKIIAENDIAKNYTVKPPVYNFEDSVLTRNIANRDIAKNYGITERYNDRDLTANVAARKMEAVSKKDNRNYGRVSPVVMTNQQKQSIRDAVRGVGNVGRAAADQSRNISKALSSALSSTLRGLSSIGTRGDIDLN